MPEPQRKVRVPPLVSVQNVVREMATVYRLARRGELEAEAATKLVFILNSIRSALDGAEADRRLEALEAKFL